uniref:C2 domain-containing protein n=1 Tax=Tetranychus urticae TaxID=32264 RepID=T1K5X1_TETUR
MNPSNPVVNQSSVNPINTDFNGNKTPIDSTPTVNKLNASTSNLAFSQTVTSTTSEVTVSSSSSSSDTVSKFTSSQGSSPALLSEIPDANSDNNNGSFSMFGYSSFPSKTYLASYQWLTSPFTAWLLSATGFVILALIFTLIYQRIRKRNRKLRELRHLTPETSLSSFPGSRSNFALDREYLSTPARTRQRHLTGHNYSLSPFDINPPLYGSRGGLMGLSDVQLPTSEKWIGRVIFVLHYNLNRQRLLVTLLSASDLPKSEKRSSLNPSAKLTLLPFNDPKFVTKVHKNTCNPVFNELFVFPARKDNLDEIQLKIAIVDNDRFSRKYFVGQCVYSITQSGIQNGITSDVITDEILCTLSTEKTAASPGELQVSLCYRASEATLTLTIMKARGLAVKDVTSVYPKVSLFLGKKRIGSKKSPVRKAYSAIDFNDSFHVHIKDTAIDNVNIVISLIGRTSIGLNTRHNFGKIYLGDCNSPNGAVHWAEMIKSSPNPIIKWHPLNRNI